MFIYLIESLFIFNKVHVGISKEITGSDIIVDTIEASGSWSRLYEFIVSHKRILCLLFKQLCFVIVSNLQTSVSLNTSVNPSCVHSAFLTT